MENDTNALAKPHVLCDRCLQLFKSPQIRQILDSDDLKRSSFKLSFRASARDVQESGLRGCHFCSIVSQGLCPAHSDRDLLKSPLVIAIHFVSKLKKVDFIEGQARQIFASELDLNTRLEDASREFIKENSIWVRFGSAEESLRQSRVPSNSVWSISTGSDSTFELAREWLHHCQAHHTLCEEVRTKPVTRTKWRFPSYLVYIGPDTLQLRSFTSDSSDSLPEYLTLSHRWGGSHIFTLITRNLSSLLSAIPEASLPKTFRDAIMITRRLGHQYIWIDSLCIVQDSKQHWQTESAIMGDIYRGSVCTIAALGSTDGDGGCFKSRNPLCFQHCKIDADLAGRTIWVQPENEGNLWNSTGASTNSRVEPLHERAWVMQERFLSPRTIFYGTLGVYWECVAAQATHHTSKMETSPPTAKYVINEMCTRTVTGTIDTSYRQFHKWWVNVVTMYNSCNLTYGTDKLVAISAIIKLLEGNTGLHNIAGLWRETALSELLWIANAPAERPTDVYQAPSWSWASLNAPVGAGLQIFIYDFSWKAEILEMISHQVADNGQISGAYIRVRAPMLQVRVETIESGYILRWGMESPMEDSADDRVTFIPDVHLEHEQDLWALLFVHCTESTSWMKIGLVVTKTGTTEREEWILVGSFRQYDWPSSSTSFFEGDEAEIKEIVIV